MKKLAAFIEKRQIPRSKAEHVWISLDWAENQIAKVLVLPSLNG